MNRNKIMFAVLIAWAVFEVADTIMYIMYKVSMANGHFVPIGSMINML